MLWKAFWRYHFLFGLQVQFIPDYVQAWKLAYPDYSITIYLDGRIRIDVPCPAPGESTDDALWNHITCFYGLARAQGRLGYAYLAQQLCAVDIIEVGIGLLIIAHVGLG